MTSSAAEPLRVVWIAEGGLWGGIESHLRNLAEGLRASPVEVEAKLLVLEQGPVLDWAKASGAVAATLVPRSGTSGTLRALRHAVASVNPHTIHAHGLVPEVLTALACARTWSCVSTVHRLPGRRPWDAPDRGAIASTALWTSRRLAFRKLLAVTSDVRERLVASGLGNERCEVVYNGVSAPAPGEAAHREGVRSQLGLSSDTCLFGIVGRLDPVKGHARLIRAVAQARAASPTTAERAIVVVVGEGPLRAELEALAADLDVTRNVRFLGFREDVGEIMSALDVGVFASDHEGHPLAALEMMIRGVPLIAPAVGGLPEIIEHDRTGLLVSPASESGLAEAMTTLTFDAPRRARLGLAAEIEAHDRFGTDAMVKRLVDIWREVGDRGGSLIRR